MLKKRFKAAVDGVLGDAGFLRKGQSWYLTGPDTVVVVELQKCDWDDFYFFNIGLAIRSLGAVDFPTARTCHVSARLEALFPGLASIIRRGSSLGGSEDELGELLEALRGSFVPFALIVLELEQVKEFGAAGRFDRALVFKEARKLWESGP